MTNRQAFTLLEIIVVMIILGVLTAIAVPNFNSSISRAQVQEAKNNLLSIYAGQKNKEANGNGFYASAACANPPADHDGSLGTGLGISIPFSNINYCCDASGFVCRAGKVGGGFVMQVSNAPIVLSSSSPYPLCTAGFNPCCASSVGGVSNCQ